LPLTLHGLSSSPHPQSADDEGKIKCLHPVKALSTQHTGCGLQNLKAGHVYGYVERHWLYMLTTKMHRIETYCKKTQIVWISKLKILPYTLDRIPLFSRLFRPSLAHSFSPLPQPGLPSAASMVTWKENQPMEHQSCIQSVWFFQLENIKCTQSMYHDI